MVIKINLMFAAFVAIATVGCSVGNQDSVSKLEINSTSNNKWVVHKIQPNELQIDSIYLLGSIDADTGIPRQVRLVLEGSDEKQVHIEYGDFPYELWNAKIIFRQDKPIEKSDLSINKIYEGQSIPEYISQRGVKKEKKRRQSPIDE